MSVDTPDEASNLGTGGAVEGLLPADSEQSPDLSFILPTKNERAGIRRAMEEIHTVVRDLDLTAEVIVSDSSMDDTGAIARDWGATVIEPDRLGYGFACRSGFERARGKYVVMGDADATYDFRECSRLLERIRQTEADIVIGSRFSGDIHDDAMPALHQYVGNPSLTAFLNLFYDLDVTDAHSGFRVMTADALDKLSFQSDGMEFATEMLVEASRRDLEISEVPITYRQRVGEATLDTFADGWKHLEFMLLNAPGYFFSVPGLMSTFLGVSILALSFLEVGVFSAGGGGGRFGIRSMFAGSLLTIVGYQIASLGMFAVSTASPPGGTSHSMTSWLAEQLQSETGLLFGLCLAFVGAAFAGVLLATWALSGYQRLPTLSNSILAFTAMVLGVQTVFSSLYIGYFRTGQPPRDHP